MTLAEIETLRLEFIQKTKYNPLYITLAAIGLLILLILIKQTWLTILYLLAGSAVGSIIYGKQNKVHEKFRQAFKQTVISEFLVEKLKIESYQPTNRIANSEFNQSQLFPTNYTKVVGEDLIEFSGFGNLKLSELDVTKETIYKDSDGKEQKKVETYFSGVYGYATFPFKFEGKTIVRPKNFFEINVGLENVRLESVRFMELWSVSSDTQLGARLALGTDIMNNLLYLKEHLKERKIHMSFVGQRVYFAIEQNKFLEPNWKIPVENQESVQDLILEIQTMQKIIDTFKLHQNLKTN
jgi:hypothetical protein